MQYTQQGGQLQYHQVITRIVFIGMRARVIDAALHFFFFFFC
jgi:hypothetical protein